MLFTVLILLAVLAVLFLAGAVATREDDILLDAPPDDPDLRLPDGPLQPEDLAEVRFSLALRGYRMSEVDDVLARATAEIALRDARLASLEQALNDRPVSAPSEIPLSNPTSYDAAVASHFAFPELHAPEAARGDLPPAEDVQDARPIGGTARPASVRMRTTGGSVRPGAGRATAASGPSEPLPEILPVTDPEPLPETKPLTDPEPLPEVPPFREPKPAPEPPPTPQVDPDTSAPLGQPGEGVAGRPSTGGSSAL